jgi:hypothetical protein
VKRIVAVLAAVVLPAIGFAPPAHSVGYGACSIAGTITFSPETPSAGRWTIGPATIDCKGIIGKRARPVGPGPFRGSGSFAALPPGDAACLRQTGTGKVEYEIPTFSGVIKVSEKMSHTLAGAGVLDTPTLHGPFQIAPPHEGDCVTKPLTRARFMAQVVLHRNPRQFPPPLPGV